MSRKTERLVNLTIALLATKRYITKSEIFRTVDGYEGTAESKERMFERDKDDLRNLGIEIEVGSFDPLFEDEAGYRIKPDSYQFQLGEVTSQEISLLSLAAEAWRGAALDGSALTALRKLHAIGIESDIESIPDLAPYANIRDKNLQVAISAITSRQKISFKYLSEELGVKVQIDNLHIVFIDRVALDGVFIEDQEKQSTYRIQAKLGYNFNERFLANIYGTRSNIASATAAGFTFTEVGFVIKWDITKKPTFYKKITLK